MGNFYLIKYPVISKSGREYRVDVCADRLYGGHVMCGVFEKRKGLFGRDKFVQLNSTSIGRHTYDEIEWEYDYVSIAINEIDVYEESIREQLEYEEGRRKGAIIFDEWDGEASE